MSRADRILIAAGGGALILAIAAAWVMLAPVAGELPPDGDTDAAMLLGTPVASASAAPETGSATIVVDLQGAVAEPGIRELPAAARVADAIAAAGGYATDADLAAASASINLAEPLTDGAQITVPRIGEAVATAPGPSTPAAPTGSGSSAGSGSGGGLVNLNTATPEELDALPGIGPVTVQKIVAARQERPFASLDDAVARGVIHRGQLEDIAELATAG